MSKNRSKTDSTLKRDFLHRFAGKVNFISKTGLQTLLLPNPSPNKENLRLPTFSTLDKK